MPTIIKPPTQIIKNTKNKSIFLAGTIEMGKSIDWQKQFETADYGGAFKDLIIYNPRRDNWDPTWKQSIDNPKFKEQVDWELDALEKATVIPMYFDPTTKSPITLLELGLFATSGKLLVCCPEGFWRKGNVDIVCQRNNIETFDSLDSLIDRTILELYIK